MKSKHHGVRKRIVKKSRKDVRKEQRCLAKAKKHRLYLQHHGVEVSNLTKAGISTKLQSNKKLLNANGESLETKTSVKGKKSKSKKGQQMSILDHQQAAQEEKRKHELLLKEMEQERCNQLKRANEDEERLIKRLEKKLSMNKKHRSKQLPKSFLDDGLDYLLGVCDFNDESANDYAKGLEDLDFPQEEVENGKPNGQKAKSSPHSNHDAHNDSGENQSDDYSSTEYESEMDIDSVDGEMHTSEEKSNDEKGKMAKKRTHAADDLEVHTVKRSEVQSKKQKLDSSDATEPAAVNVAKCNENGDDVWEDIYGRLRNKAGAVVQDDASKNPKRLGLSDGSPNEKLARQLKGCINRLSENNLHSIAVQIEEIYTSNSRNEVNESLAKVITSSAAGVEATPERLTMEIAILISILHGNVGTEVGAFFIQYFIGIFDNLWIKENSSEGTEGKQINNCLLIICHLYSFKVVYEGLIYDILKLLGKSLTERSVELILSVLKAIGFNIRKDDPLQFKEMLTDLQAKSMTNERKSDGSRLGFMLEMLTALKNNNMNKIPNYDPTYLEHLKKLLKGFIRKGNSFSPLKISYGDLIGASAKGRWWIVGSSWCNDTNNPKSDTTGNEAPETDSGGAAPFKTVFSQKVLDLAKKQRMNTATRRNIFCIVVTSEDYIDCFEKLVQLGLTGESEREIVIVIVHCCLSEKTYNPYYGLVLGRFASTNRKYQMMIQCNLWDKFKDLHNFKSFQANNLTELIVYLVINKHISLSVLKVLHFGDMNKVLVKFLRKVLLGILLHEDLGSVKDAFQRVSASKSLNIFRESIKLFIDHFILAKNKDDMFAKQDLLIERTNIANHYLMAANISRLKL